MNEEGGLSDRQILLSRLLDAVKQCQIRFGGRKELATESDSRVVNLCTQFEAVLQHGMKKSKGLSSIRQVSEIVRGLNLWNADSDYVFWHFVRTHLTKHELERYLVLRHVTSDEGRGRAWLRSALNEHALERYMHMLLADPGHLSQFYEESAFLMDQETSSVLPTMSAGLGSILFAINIDNPDLNPPESSVVVRAPAQASEPRPVIARPMVDVKRKKKRRKPRSNVVSFDDEEDDTDDRYYHSCFSAPATCVSSPVAAEFPPAIALQPESPRDEEAALGTAAEDARSVESLTPSDVATDGNVSDEPGPRSGGPLGSGSQPQERIKTWSGSTESSDSPRRDIPSSVSSSPLSGRECGGSSFQPSALTPILDMSIGDLIPIGHPPKEAHALDEGEAPTTTWVPSRPAAEDVPYIPSYSEDTESAAAALALAQNLALDAATPHQPTAVEDSAPDTTSATPEELRQALLVVTQHVKDVEQENSSLKRLLEREAELNAKLRADALETEKAVGERTDKQDAKIQTLTRENELLKHQLKKYIAAVQLLKRDGLAAHQSLQNMVGEVEPAIPEPKAFIDHRFEAGEYEKKLVQVAEMHGELMEFNERLHRLLLFRETTIRRLREELTDLRGPLPDENQTSDDDNLSITSDYDASSQTASRPLINIWIPSAFLAGHRSDAFHVYQVYVRIRDDEWNVYRRYSQFYALHKALRKSNPVVGSFDFPPKKSIGNKDAKVVEERRKRLQRYLRCVLNWMAQTSSELLESPDKSTLVTLLPFFREQDPVNPRARTSRRSHQRLRVPAHSSGGSSGTPSHPQQQTPVPHYMGH
ncbi:sorting nexin-29 [Ixodes scapularis]